MKKTTLLAAALFGLIVATAALLMVASAGVAQSSKTNSAVTGFIATTADKPANGAVIGFIATTADEPANAAYEFVDKLVKSITSEDDQVSEQVSEKAVLEPVLYSYYHRLERTSCGEIPGIGSIAGQDPPTFRRYKVHVLRVDDEAALVNVFSRAKTGTLNLALDLHKINGKWKIFDVCSTGEKPHYCYRSEVKNWKC